MYWTDIIITLALSIGIFLIIGFAASILLKVSSRKHRLGIAFGAVILALLAAFIFLMWSGAWR